MVKFHAMPQTDLDWRGRNTNARCPLFRRDRNRFIDHDRTPMKSGVYAVDRKPEPEFIPDDLLAEDVQRRFRAVSACRSIMGEMRRLAVVLEVCDQHSLTVRANQAAGKTTARLRDVEKLIFYRIPTVYEACSVVAVLATDFRVGVALMNRHGRMVPATM